MKVLVIDPESRVANQIGMFLRASGVWPEDLPQPEVVLALDVHEAKAVLTSDSAFRVVVANPLAGSLDATSVDAYEFVRARFPGIPFFFASPTFTASAPPPRLIGWDRLPRDETVPTWRLIDMWDDEWSELTWLRDALRSIAT